jgi:hypothetical protein
VEQSMVKMARRPEPDPRLQSGSLERGMPPWQGQ